MIPPARGPPVSAFSHAIGLKPERTFSPASAIPFGSIGGVFSGLFGSGGFIYAIYLSGRLKGKNAIRIAQTTLTGISTIWTS